jgi:hypothetical protein
MEARCLIEYPVYPRHKAPQLGCTCGVYGYYKYGEPGQLMVAGTIRASGTMLLGDKGARVEHAAIESLCRVSNIAMMDRFGNMSNNNDVDAFRDRYKVPVYNDIDTWLADFPPEDVSALLGVEYGLPGE